MGTEPRRRIVDDRVTGESPTTRDEVIARGQACWERRKADKETFGDWLQIGEALVLGRDEAMAHARTNRPIGKKYRDRFGFFLDMYGFRDIDDRTRAELLHIMDNRAAVEAYLETLSPEKRATLNCPSAVWRAFICPKRGNRGKPKAAGCLIDPPVIKAPTPLEQMADEVVEEQEETEWQRLLPKRAREAIDATRIGRWRSPEPPSPGTVEAVRQAFNAWHKNLLYMEALTDFAFIEELQKFEADGPFANDLEKHKRWLMDRVRREMREVEA